ncbi:hypothetical protein NE237_016783 [Protea cynaroides]|uniref:Aminotransferase class I/classII large domain-containing protein n=1 Tax=Protea cynaroides TaxID=273540 RepID=A0A9Q0HFG0_9MAGN|nr:hypothetical protein NE237_016783 [Protea cynaroides]
MSFSILFLFSVEFLLSLNKAIAEYLSVNLPYKLSPDDVNLTIYCVQAIEVVISMLAQPRGNILLPRPGYTYYEGRAAFSHLEVRHFDLLPDKGWKINLDAVEALANENTIAMVIVSPGSPCGNVFTYWFRLFHLAYDLAPLALISRFCVFADFLVVFWLFLDLTKYLILKVH